MGKKNKKLYNEAFGEEFMNEVNSLMDSGMSESNFDFLKPNKKKKRKEKEEDSQAYQDMLDAIYGDENEVTVDIEEPETEEEEKETEETYFIQEPPKASAPLGDYHPNGYDSIYEDDDYDYEEDLDDGILSFDYDTKEAVLFNSFGDPVLDLSFEGIDRGIDETKMENPYDQNHAMLKRALLLLRKPSAILDSEWFIEIQDTTINISELLKQYNCNFGNRTFWVKVVNPTDSREFFYLLYHMTITDEEDVNNFIQDPVFKDRHLSIEQELTQLSQLGLLNPLVCENPSRIFNYVKKLYEDMIDEDLVEMVNQLIMNEIINAEFEAGPTKIETPESANEGPSLHAFMLDQYLNEASCKEGASVLSEQMNLQAHKEEVKEVQETSEDIEDVEDGSDIIPSREEALEKTMEWLNTPEEEKNEEVTFGGEEEPKKKMTIQSMPKPQN